MTRYNFYQNLYEYSHFEPSHAITLLTNTRLTDG